MLVALAIRDIVIIDRLSIDFAGGLTVLTGETGAGKSILLDSLSLALGGRGDAALVRARRRAGRCHRRLRRAGGHPARAILADSGIEAEGDLILRRVQGADGRSRAFVNDQPVSVGAAAPGRRGAGRDPRPARRPRAWSTPAVHRALLDAFGGLDAERDGGRRPRIARWRAAEAAVAALRGADRRGPRARPTTCAPRSTNWRRWRRSRTRRRRSPTGAQQMMRAEKIAGDIAEAHETVAGVGLAGADPGEPGAPAGAQGAGGRRAARRAVAALDKALDALEEAEQALADGAGRGQFRSARAGAHRGAPVRAARRGAQALRHGRRSAGAGRAHGRRSCGAGIRRGASRRAGEGGGRRARRLRHDGRGAVAEAPRRRARSLEKAVAAELPALKLERARLPRRHRRAMPTRRAEAGIDDVAFHGAHQSRHRSRAR